MKNKIFANFDPLVTFKAYKMNSSYDKEFKTFEECEAWIKSENLISYYPELGWGKGCGNYEGNWNDLMRVIEEIETTSIYEIVSSYDNREEYKGWIPEIFTLLPRNEIKDLSDLRFETKIEAAYKATEVYLQHLINGSKP